MQVKNYIVENRDLFIDYLEKELCQNGISYVRIDNEIHFQNQIIRLYDFELDIDSIIIMMFNEKEKTDITNNLLITFSECNKYNIFDHYKKNESDNSYYPNQAKYQKTNKRLKKQQSNQVKQKLKMYKK